MIATDLGVTSNDKPAEPVFCNKCNQSITPTGPSGWECPVCRQPCFFGHCPGVCEEGHKCIAIRQGHVFFVVCDQCAAPRLARRDKIEAAREKRKEKNDPEQAASAKACWNSKNHSCDVVQNRPRYRYCQACPKFVGEPRTASPTKDRGYQPPLRDIPMEDHDLETA